MTPALLFWSALALFCACRFGNWLRAIDAAADDLRRDSDR